MIDIRSEKVLAVITEQCQENSYCVFEMSEFLFALKKYNADETAVRQILKFLKREEYIDIKYDDGGVLCMCPLPKGRYFFERKQEEKKVIKKQKPISFVKIWFLTLSSALIACFLAILLYNLIF